MKTTTTHLKKLSDAFDAVANADDWRDAIKAKVSAEDLQITVEAVMHYTATHVKVEEIRDYIDGSISGYLLTSVGYRMGPAGS